jgi:Bacterial regulatory proteins, luxR family
MLAGRHAGVADRHHPRRTRADPHRHARQRPTLRADGQGLPPLLSDAAADRRSPREGGRGGRRGCTGGSNSPCAGMVNAQADKRIAARLFVAPRTVQTHLAHLCTKLGRASRVQLASKNPVHRTGHAGNVSAVDHSQLRRRACGHRRTSAERGYTPLPAVIRAATPRAYDPRPAHLRVLTDVPALPTPHSRLVTGDTNRGKDAAKCRRQQRECSLLHGSDCRPNIWKNATQ